MFSFFRTRKIKKITEETAKYTESLYRPAPPPPPPEPKRMPLLPPEENICYSLRPSNLHSFERDENGDLIFPLRKKPPVRPAEDLGTADRYDEARIQHLMQNAALSSARFQAEIKKATDASFAAAMLQRMRILNLKPADVYSAAQVDRRLFSKIAANNGYNPSKDTCVALCLGMHLALKDARDMLSRAGYTLSHSSRRDVMLEYFFLQGIYNLNDVNEVLFRLDEKILGRS